MDMPGLCKPGLGQRALVPVIIKDRQLQAGDETVIILLFKTAAPCAVQ